MVVYFSSINDASLSINASSLFEGNGKVDITFRHQDCLIKRLTLAK